MNRTALNLIVLAASPIVAGADLGNWRDLHVHVESLAEPILVNGLPLTVSRVTGSDVDLVARRLSEKWSAESGAPGVRSETHGPWTILSRIRGAGLEVVQWRGTGGDAELLWSRSGLSAKVQAPMRGGLRFPPGCVAGRTVSGRVDARYYSQQSARCKGSPGAVLSVVQANAARQGYQVLSRDGQLLARNRTTEVTVVALPSDDGSASRITSLVYLQLQLAERAR